MPVSVVWRIFFVVFFFGAMVVRVKNVENDPENRALVTRRAAVTMIARSLPLAPITIDLQRDDHRVLRSARRRSIDAGTLELWE